MDDDAGKQPVSAMDQSCMVSPESASHSAQQASAWDSSTPGSSSRMSAAFEFASGPSGVSIPSFDPAVAAFADMSFTQPPVPSPYLQGKTTLLGPQPEWFQRRDLHDKKRYKVEAETPALDSIDYWINFDDDLDKMGSFEIDYSKRNDLTGQNRAGAATSTVPGLGSGLYSTAMAPFREEDFIDDAAFDQALSDDEDMFDSAHLGEQLSEMEALAPPAPPPEKGLYATPQTWDRTLSGPRVDPATDDTPRQMRRGIWDALPRGTNQVLSPDEQRRLLEIALNSGRMPGSLIPPNGFGIGFGAGLGARPPTEFEKRSQGSPSTETERLSSPVGASRADEAPDRAHKQGRKSAASKAGSSRKPSGPETGKPKSADRMAHNDVERKYRTNLKVKIAELRDAVPALQSPGQEAESEGGGAAHQGGAKVSKGTVLTKATEYIQQLEQRNKAIMMEHQQLARRLQAFEALFNSTARQPDLMPNHSMTLFDPRGFC
ncbi:Transcription factor CPH2 [Tolypocladium paradoxum]|uniref:Transcription factor CPH2 n=1 Tax=Tolypocladium paradoxum TaxID=94208 RepID=A0A2S4LAC3_9HYPO|nr:Transcription factor CPH2 [Tolypocladium paradoxum]